MEGRNECFLLAELTYLDLIIISDNVKFAAR
jgi:hypothetical protein